MQTGKNRCEWVGMGLVWVCWGEGSMWDTKTMHVHTKMIVHALIWVYDRGISPNVMIFEIRRRGAQMHVNTCMMSLDGCSRMRGHGGTGK